MARAKREKDKASEKTVQELNEWPLLITNDRRDHKKCKTITK